MSTMTRQQQILLLVVGVLLTAVIMDKVGLFDSGAASGSLRSQYTEQAALVERQRALVDSSDTWRDAADHATEAWQGASAQVLHARSTDLAEQDLHDRIDTEMRSQGISIAAWRAIDQPVPQNPPDTSEIRRIEVVFEFPAPSSDALYRVVDRIENMPDLWARVVSIDIEGPGIMRLDNASLDVTLRVVSVASLSSVPTRTAMATVTGGRTDVH